MSDSDEEKSSAKKDLTGRDRFAWNVMTSWLSHVFVIISGFVLPRIINDFQGSAVLGIWDFCWAFVNYMQLGNFGVGASVSRYVAKYSSKGNSEELNGTVTTMLYFQIVMAAFVVIASVTLSYALPKIYTDKLGVWADDVQLVILLLGSSLALFFVVDVFRGVLTGLHRWDVHNAIIGGTHACTFVTMAGALYFGGGLVEISAAYLIVSAISEFVRVVYAYKLCPGLHISRRYVSIKRAKKIVLFGGKTVLNALPYVLVIQTTNALVMGVLGPAALAVLMRPIALIRQVMTLINKFSFVLTPMAGSIQATEDQATMRDFLLETTRFSVAFTLPIVLFLVVFGDRILYLWMGEGYDVWSVITILAIGYFLPVSQSAANRILVGLNAHGRVALVSLLVLFVSYAIGFFIIEQVGWSLENAAILIAVSITLSRGVVSPAIACSYMQIPALTYIHKVFSVPLLCGAVYFAVLYTCRIVFDSTPYFAVLWGGIIGGVVILPMYWRWIATQDFKKNVIDYARRKLGSVSV
jgi:O-antigen/teichoic acid export membrane protein